MIKMNFFTTFSGFPNDGDIKLKIRSMVGLIPLFAVEILDDELLQSQPKFVERMRWFLDNRPDLSSLSFSGGTKKEWMKNICCPLLRGHRMKRILYRMLDETEFLSHLWYSRLIKISRAASLSIKFKRINFKCSIHARRINYSIVWRQFQLARYQYGFLLIFSSLNHYNVFIIIMAMILKWSIQPDRVTCLR